MPQTNFVPSACEIVFDRSVTAKEALTYILVWEEKKKKKKQQTPQPAKKAKKLNTS